MVVARNSLPHGVGENAANNPFQGLLHQEIVADHIGRHRRFRRLPLPNAKAEASVAGRLQTPPYAAKRKDLISEAYAALRSYGNRSIVVIGNCACGPITAEPCRAKTDLLHPRRSYFAPTSDPLVAKAGSQVEAPGTAP